MVHGATDPDVLVDARPVRAPPDAELRQGRRLARRGRRAPGGSGWRAQHELGAGRSTRAGGAHLRILRAGGAASLLQEFATETHEAWQWLLGAGRPVRALPGADPWVRQDGARIVAWIPASGVGLESLLGQIGTHGRAVRARRRSHAGVQEFSNVFSTRPSTRSRGGTGRSTRTRASTAHAPAASTFTGLRSSSWISGHASGAPRRAARRLATPPRRQAARRDTRAAAARPSARRIISAASSVVNGWMPERRIRQQVDEHAAAAAHDDRPERRVVQGADQHLDSPRHHALHE